MKQRAREIEEGLKRQFMDTIRDPTEVLNLLPTVILFAYEEIMLFFPGPDILRAFESAGLAESIKNHILRNSNVRVKLLVKGGREENMLHDYYYYQKEDSVSKANSTLMGQNNVEVMFADTDVMGANTVLVIVDGERMVTIELDDYSIHQLKLSDCIRFATHTNSESAIISNTLIFDSFWVQSEMKRRRR